MIYNTNIEMLLKSNVIQETIRKNSMLTKVLINGDEYYFLMYHHPFVIEISDLLSKRPTLPYCKHHSLLQNYTFSI